MKHTKDSIIGIARAVNMVEMSVFSLDKTVFLRELQLFEQFRFKLEQAANLEDAERSAEFIASKINSASIKQEMLGFLNQIMVGLSRPEYKSFELQESIAKLASITQDLEESIERSKNIVSSAKSVQQTSWRDLLIEARLESLKVGR